ncbi:elongation factor 4 [Microgenomates group bacterium RIFCSPHIGHO2_01_FULL_45_11]|nr:MAG: elongation factor 4 [Microgenomates group bacterium RIFCSPHIGHO2_01_FULL_45_11]
MDQSLIRNFSIIAHIDHGKTTLTDRLLEMTGTVKGQVADRLLDSHPIERERGITIKLAPVTMSYQLPSINNQLSTINYQLNLIDTPGHVDFSYEVERSLAASEAAILLVDATQGVQAQTVAHATMALAMGLRLLPVINKIDLDSANIEQTTTELISFFGFKREEISRISARTGQGVEELLVRLVREVKPPAGRHEGPLRALVFNSVYDAHLGLIIFVRVVDGALVTGARLKLLRSGINVEPREIGIFSPQRQERTELTTGQVGYVATGLKNVAKVSVGDTLTSSKFRTENSKNDVGEDIESLPGYREPQPTVFADFYPGEEQTFEELKQAVERLKLTDAALTTQTIHSSILGSGLRLGFLGLFHIEITRERLAKDLGMATVVTNPTVEYQVTTTRGEIVVVHNANELPQASEIALIKEPMTKVTMLTPQKFVGLVMEMAQYRRGVYQTTEYVGNRVRLVYLVPLVELISGFFNALKSVSAGFATLSYLVTGTQRVDVVKLDILLNQVVVEPLSRIVVRERVEMTGRKLVETIKELMPRQQFAVPIQAAVGGQIVARETKPAVRKDVTAKLYGGDQTRKDKLLKKQKKGKKRLARFGKVSLSEEVLTKLATVS